MDNRILDIDLSTQELNLVRASQGKRFGNYFIDRFALKLVSSLFSISSTTFMLSDIDIDTSRLFGLVGIYLLFDFLYYFLLEFNLGGKTLGKYVTNTRVVNMDGSKPTADTIALRSISRYVPFEIFSFLGGDRPIGWHDRWSKTIVIDEKLSTFQNDDYIE